MLVFIIILGVFFYFLYKSKHPQKKKLIQEEMSPANVSIDGLAQNGNEFRMTIEVEPANLDTASDMEHQMLWINFLGLVNTLNVPYTLLMQSNIFEMKDYTDEYERHLEENDLPVELYESGKLVKEHFEQTLEDGVRDYRGYVILKYNPLDASTSNVQTGVGKLDSMIGKAIPQKNKMSNTEKENLAKQVLEETAEMIFSFCEQVGMRYQLLGRAGTLNCSYQFLNRDISPYARMIDAIQNDSFNPHKKSLTEEQFNA